MSPSFGDDLASCEIFDPRNNSWRTVASMKRPRGYHSTALLLPDGSVFVGGDQGEGSDPNETTSEIYYPWYFSAPSRPGLSSAPAEGRYGQEVTLGTSSTGIARVVLVRAGSTTHGMNTDQRAVELSFRAVTGGLAAQVPSNPNLAPPGYYLVFLVDSSNVPSTGRFIRLYEGTTTLPTVTAAAGDANASEAGPDPGTFTLTRTGDTSAALTVSFTMGGTATPGTDYASPGGSVTFAAGAATATVTVSPVDDAAVEGSETAILTLSAGAGYSVGTPGSATVTIADNDAGTPPPPPPPQVTGFTLINADTDQPIPGFDPLSPDATLDLSALPTRNLSIRANTEPAAVGSVRFGYDGNPNYRTENMAPYALNGDTNGDYAPWTPGLGAHSVSATPYSSADGAGTAGETTVLTFTAVESGAGQPPAPAPPPVAFGPRDNENGNTGINDRCSSSAAPGAGAGWGWLALLALAIRRRRRD